MAKRLSAQINIRVTEEFKALVAAVHLERPESVTVFIREAYRQAACGVIVNARGDKIVVDSDWDALEKDHPDPTTDGAMAQLLGVIAAKKRRLR